MDLSARYRQLNAAQKQAVDTIDGPVMVVAGPGTGKTELLSVRIANILSKTDTLPQNILCLTFTESGAAAMRERLIGIIGKDAYKVAIHTFHSFGSEIINQNREFFYNGAVFEPADDLTRYELLRGIFSELDYKNPLASTMNGEYTHQNDAARVISELKQSGLTSDELRTILDNNELALDAAERLIVPHFSGTVSKSTAGKLVGELPKLQELANVAETLFEVTPLISVIADGLANAIDQAQTIHPTKPLTAWKKKWLTKNTEGQLVFKSRHHIAKLRALAYIYNEYLRRMEAAGLFDYDDMILQVVHAMEVNDDLRYNLQEKYLYMMVDEFQDTNLAQMRILHNLTDNPVNEGRPNIMVVGDDDQAIYSFQGADISNILRFRELYPSTELITLKDNYRSVEEVLVEARSIIVQGEDRLEHRIEELDKTLTANHKGSATVGFHQADTAASERHWLIESIKKQLKAGVKGESIAVLARRHAEIGSLLPYFTKAGIPVHYERQDNALDEAPIIALELLAKVIVGLSAGDHDEVNGLMPELLAHPAWRITAPELWRLSSDAYDARKRWLDIMETTPRFVPIHTWLIELAQKSLNEPLEVMLDSMIGRPLEDEAEETFHSPFYDYYFSAKALEANPVQYLDYLTAIQTIRSHLREYSRDKTPTVTSFVGFLALYRQLGARLPMTRVVGEGDSNAVNLMTAHKSKGLEFDTVYVMNSVDSVWGEKARSPSRTIGYPENLPLAPVGDSADERLRLFYVAMTRAKNQLFISFSLVDDRRRPTLLASFLADKETAAIDQPTDIAAHTEAAELAWFSNFVTPTPDLKTLLAPQLSKYKLSATHLNNFLDVVQGGPQMFLLNNLLHFPSAKSAAASYGSAVHNTLQQAHIHLSSTGERKPIEDILHDFEVALTRERLDAKTLQIYLQKGSEQLTAFFEKQYDSFTTTQKAELNFSNQDVYINEAHLTGMIDVVDINTDEKTMCVTDYKTGKPIKDGIVKTDYEKVKLHKYRQQLLFYKLLVENSRDYNTYTATEGRLLFVEATPSGEVVQTVIEYDREEIERLKQLVTAVWKHVITLDLPDISGYDQNYKGLLAFEQDLIDGVI